MTHKKIFQDFIIFSNKQIYSRDIDPAYPVLKQVHKFRNMSKNEAIWHTLLYIAWYNLGSSEIVWKEYPQSRIIDKKFILKTGIERRGFRGNNKGVETLNWIIKNNPDLEKWLNVFLDKRGKYGWELMYKEFQKIPNCGTWAAYKWCDLCKNVLGYDITAPDIGLGGRGEKAGPISGLSLLINRDLKFCAENIEVQENLFQFCLQSGINFDGLEEFETCLCDFKSLYKGSYYTGHDLDKQMEDIKDLDEVFWKSRKILFPREYLGEFNGWWGERKELNKLYKEKSLC